MALAQALREAEPEMRTQIRKHTKPVVEPVWQEAVRGRVQTRMQARVLSDSARVAVSDQNVMLRSAGAGRLSSGVERSRIYPGVEFGANRDAVGTATSTKGKRYPRRTRRQFQLPRRKGYVVFNAAREVIPRIASLWVQTAVRTLHEKLEQGGVR